MVCLRPRIKDKTNMKKVIICSAVIILVGLILILSNQPQPVKKVWIGGGPQGGTFIVFANGLTKLLQQELPGTEIKVIGSGGSVANLRNIQSGKLDLALVFAGDAYLGRQGKLDPDYPPFDKILALGRVYSSTAQLAVPQGSTIHTAYDLVNHRIAIGCSGSGAAHSAKLYFNTLGIWEQITPIYLGYGLGIEELIKGRAEAVWQLVGAPSTSITALNNTHPIRLLNLVEPAQKKNFFQQFPFYTEAVIPPDTYPGVDQSIHTFQDNTLLITHPDADTKLIEATVKVLFSPEGISYMHTIHPIAQELKISKGLQGIQIPLHPQAIKFWQKQGLVE